IIGADGRSHRVIGVYPQSEKEIYRITFSDGVSVECCADHLWRLQSTNHRKRGQEGVVLSLREFMHDLRSRQGNNRWYIPMVRPVEFPAQELPVDPYLLGLLLGDGYLGKGRVSLTTLDGEIVQAARELVADDGLRLVVTRGTDYHISAPRGRANVLLRRLRV